MNNEYWKFVCGLTKEYGVFRKAIMDKFNMSAIEVDVILFLANNPRFDTASDIARVRKITKSHVSLAIKRLTERGFLTGEPDILDHKKIRLKITYGAAEMVCFGQECQGEFFDELFAGFSEEELQEYLAYCGRIMDNIASKQAEREKNEQYK